MLASHGALLVCHCQGGPELCRVSGIRCNWKLKLRRHHADHAVSCSVERDVLTNDSRIRSKLITPEAFAEYDHMVVAGLIFIAREDASQ